MATQGGNHDQHVKAGQQSHKNSDSSTSASKSASSRNDQNSGNSSNNDQNASSSTRGGTHEQHVKAGQQSHKNSH